MAWTITLCLNQCLKSSSGSLRAVTCPFFEKKPHWHQLDLKKTFTCHISLLANTIHFPKQPGFWVTARKHNRSDATGNVSLIKKNAFSYRFIPAVLWGQLISPALAWKINSTRETWMCSLKKTDKLHWPASITNAYFVKSSFFQQSTTWVFPVLPLHWSWYLQWCRTPRTGFVRWSSLAGPIQPWNLTNGNF